MQVQGRSDVNGGGGRKYRVQGLRSKNATYTHTHMHPHTRADYTAL